MRAPSVAGQLWDKISRVVTLGLRGVTPLQRVRLPFETFHFAGLSANRYQLEEILESEVKTRSQDLGTVAPNQ